MVQVIFTSFFLLLTLSLGVSGRQCGRQVGGAVGDGCGEGGDISKIIPRGRFEFVTNYKDEVQCGQKAGGAVCEGGLYCCSKDGFCGTTDAYCGHGCQSYCYGDKDPNITNILPRERFEEMLKHRSDYHCGTDDFYTYEAFVSAANAFPDFGNSINPETRERDVAAFFGQTSHETDGAPKHSSDPYTWGYCHITEQDPEGDYCDDIRYPNYPCAPEKQYYGRGPIMLKWSYNYGRCGEAIGEDLLNNPDLLETNSTISFKSAIWFWMTENSTKPSFWMTEKSTKPSCHNVSTGHWRPSNDDNKAHRKLGYGLTTNIINGTNECGKGPNIYGENRIGYFKRYCDMFGIEYGDNLDCYDQTPYGDGPVDLVNSM